MKRTVLLLLFGNWCLQSAAQDLTLNIAPQFYMPRKSTELWSFSGEPRPYKGKPVLPGARIELGYFIDGFGFPVSYMTTLGVSIIAPATDKMVYRSSSSTFNSQYADSARLETRSTAFGISMRGGYEIPVENKYLHPLFGYELGYLRHKTDVDVESMKAADPQAEIDFTTLQVSKYDSQNGIVKSGSFNLSLFLGVAYELKSLYLFGYGGYSFTGFPNAAPTVGFQKQAIFITAGAAIPIKRF